MASKSYQFVCFAIVAIILPTVAMATDYVVGDDEGWKVGVNYTEWAKDKVFYVGDRLVFQYQSPHNVYKVNGDQFKNCIPSNDLLNTGNDTIPLGKPGKKWYICGATGHCAQGQKLVINVESNGPISDAPESNGPISAPAPTPESNDSYTFVSSWFQILIAAVVAIAIVTL
ncbi:hypothetical protein JCGZ_02694 [Jatropha curcas]|uniref:Phytocyanin domain-containing protein n=1 Tax=Jatropha curcas TaxID=180498 RepID=A0A067L6H1_JATCU|nr:blue copper protein 1a [Jatropha curcas]KDP39674.1 hypothetical protein JCGZ_02694 [Jatropha curcas]